MTTFGVHKFGTFKFGAATFGAVLGITIIYTPWGGTPVTLTLPGASFENPSGYLPGDDIVRALDGTLNSYKSFRKRTKSLKWEYLTDTQKAGLETLYAYGVPFIFADAMDTANQFIALMIGAPVLNQVAKGAWSGEVEIQQI